MEKLVSPFLATVLFLGTALTASASEQGPTEAYRLKTSYECATAGIPVRTKTRLLNPNGELVVRYNPMAGESPVLTFGKKEAMLWPKSSSGSFDKTLTVMERTGKNQYIIAQEIDLGEAQKTRTELNIDVKGPNPHEPVAVNCKVEMQWVKR